MTARRSHGVMGFASRRIVRRYARLIASRERSGRWSLADFHRYSWAVADSVDRWRRWAERRTAAPGRTA